jgi:hypothetical protein
MAGGSSLSAFNRFTLYTPNTAAIIQKFLEGKAVLDAASPTGFSKWNPATARMEPSPASVSKAPPRVRAPRKPQTFGVPVVTLVGYYDPTAALRTYAYPALHGAPASATPTTP